MKSDWLNVFLSKQHGTNTAYYNKVLSVIYTNTNNKLYCYNNTLEYMTTQIVLKKTHDANYRRCPVHLISVFFIQTILYVWTQQLWGEKNIWITSKLIGAWHINPFITLTLVISHSPIRLTISSHSLLVAACRTTQQKPVGLPACGESLKPIKC